LLASIKEVCALFKKYWDLHSKALSAIHNKVGPSFRTIFILNTLVVALLSNNTAVAEILFQSDFKDKSLQGIYPELPNQTNNTFVPWSDRYVFRLQVYATDPLVNGKKRAELTWPALASNGAYTYRFSEFLPSDYVPDRSAESIAQWHDTPDTYLGESYRIPALAILTQNGHIKLNGRWDPNALTVDNTPGPGGGVYSADLGPYTTGQWNNFAVYVHWSYGKDGFLAIYNNGVEIFRRTGPNYYNDKVGPYMKLGIYKWDWTDQPGYSEVQRRTMFLDNVRVNTGLQ